jgi:Mg2+-importing ATPase
LVFAAAVSGVLQEYSDGIIIIGVLVLMGLFTFIQEWRANKAVNQLQLLVHSSATVLRNSATRDVKISEVVPGDVILLNAGDIVPADGLLIECKDLHVNESSLTGESYPAEKMPGILSADTALSQRTNVVFEGTSVINGSASFIAVCTGNGSEMGQIKNRLHVADPENHFEKEIRQFGYMLLRVTLTLSVFIFTMNLFLDKPVLGSLLFSLAIAVGLAPELLPMILTVTMTAGAKRLADKNVIVKKLNVIQNLGQMTVLCTDKTGTITEGVAKLDRCLGIEGMNSAKVKLYACLNASFETGFSNPIDDALRSVTDTEVQFYSKIDEVPYDFIRKRLSIVVSKDNRSLMITKGAYKNILSCCTSAELSGNDIVELDKAMLTLDQLYSKLNEAGYRCIAICYKDVTNDPVINKDDECNMVFLGLLTFEDPLKRGIIKSVSDFRAQGIKIKLITGDNLLAAKHISQQIGLNTEKIISGIELQQSTSEAFRRTIELYDVFAEIEPSQKEQIIRALRLAGHTVGYLGDGINDAQALKTADVGISVDQAVDVAKESATVVLLNKDIDVLLEGIIEGRRTFVNTQKYIFLTTSANFGNMFSMGILSIVLPFLPLLPTQILLNNFLSDLPTLALASDKVDAATVKRPTIWNIKNTRKFMIIYGIQSSVFDMLTFATLYFIFRASPATFRTAWFIESLLTEVIIIFIIRTGKSVLKSRPSTYLISISLSVVIISVVLPYLPIGDKFGMTALPINLLICIIVISMSYGLVGELLKKRFLRFSTEI